MAGGGGRGTRAVQDAELPTIPGIDRAVSLDEARAFLESLGAGGAIMLKAAGRRRRARHPRRAGHGIAGGELAETFERCRSEATSAFGNGAGPGVRTDGLYVEQYLPAGASH